MTTARRAERIPHTRAPAIAELRARVLDAPLLTVGLAAAAGWALGGGLGPRMVASLVVTAGRAMLWNAIAATFARRPTPSVDVAR